MSEEELNELHDQEPLGDMPEPQQPLDDPTEEGKISVHLSEIFGQEPDE